MNISFCLGNGESRVSQDVEPLRDAGPVYGCNFIYQDYHVDNLVACDLHVAKEIISSGYHTRCNFYTRDQHYSELNQPQSVKVLPELKKKGRSKHEKAQNWGSGLYAAYIACQHSDVVVLLGYDLNGFNETSNNNLYKKQLRIPGTDYEDKPVDAEFWIKQFEILFDWFPDVTFAFINKDTWSSPLSWESYDNWTIDNYNTLQQFILDNKI